MRLILYVWLLYKLNHITCDDNEHVHLKVHIPEIRQKHTHVQRVNKHHFHPKKVLYDYSPHSIEFDHFKVPFRKRKHMTDYEYIADNDHYLGQGLSYYKAPDDNMLETLKFLQDFYEKHKKKTSVYHGEPPEDDYAMDLSPIETSKYSIEESDWKTSPTSSNYRPVYMDNIWMPYSGLNWKASLMDRKRRHSNVNEPIGFRYKYY